MRLLKIPSELNNNATVIHGKDFKSTETAAKCSKVRLLSFGWPNTDTSPTPGFAWAATDHHLW